MDLFLAGAFWIVCAAIASQVGARKGMAGAGFVQGLMLGPLGIVAALVSRGDRKECPYCRELVHSQATVCSHCCKGIDQVETSEVRCPHCGESGQMNVRLQGSKVECPSCHKVFSTEGHEPRSAVIPGINS